MSVLLTDKEARVIGSFSRHAGDYERHAQLQRAMAERLAALLPQPPPASILELGCGTGIFSRMLAQRFPNQPLTLNDIAPAMIEHGRAAGGFPGHARILPGNAETIALPPATLIAANAVFQWFERMPATLQKFAALLPPSGELIFSVFGARTLEHFREFMPCASPAILFTREQWETMLRDAGLQLRSADTEQRDCFFPSTLALLKNLQQTGAAPLPLLRTGTLRQLLKTHDAARGGAQGVRSTWEIFYFSASKPAP